MQRKKWITDSYGINASSAVYFTFTLFRMKIVDNFAPQNFMKVIYDKKVKL